MTSMKEIYWGMVTAIEQGLKWKMDIWRKSEESKKKGKTEKVMVGWDERGEKFKRKRRWHMDMGETRTGKYSIERYTVLWMVVLIRFSYVTFFFIISWLLFLCFCIMLLRLKGTILMGMPVYSPIKAWTYNLSLSFSKVLG